MENAKGLNACLVIWHEAEPGVWDGCLDHRRWSLNIYIGTKCNNNILLEKENKVNKWAKQIVANREVLSKTLAQGS